MSWAATTIESREGDRGRPALAAPPARGSDAHFRELVVKGPRRSGAKMRLAIITDVTPVA
jgi:hypothetical protein